ncbi:hypothetical protein [Tautonia rosea]|uniref:hypothetical protein n=1 Tax=Tautonia rosea TaxID=2728037 RepID=UPI001473308F|nr:hypothetical protein [Tautonia rosea]
MAERLGRDQEPEVFDRLQRLALHERRRRWDSTRNALAAGAGELDDKSQGASMPSDMLIERFEWIECQMTLLAKELRRVEHRSKMIALRARIAVVLGLVTAFACMGLWSGTLQGWFLSIPGSSNTQAILGASGSLGGEGLGGARLGQPPSDDSEAR